MTTYKVPYTFVPGTKAKATEVNANFDTVVDFIEELNTNCASKDLSNLSPEGLSVIYNNSYNSKLLGEIITSIVPLVDSGLHLLDGSIISGSGMYHEFVDYIARISEIRPDLFVSEEVWHASLVEHGVCGKFVYDSEHNTVRLPKVSGFVQGSSSIIEAGDYVNAGLPNHSHGPITLGATVTDNGASSGNYVLMHSNGAKSSRTVETSESGTVLDTTIYGQSSTVQPPAIKVLYYIVMTTTTKQDVAVDIDEVVTDLNSKLDTSLIRSYPIETYNNGTEWYKVYSDGWIEQGGYASVNGTPATVTFLKPFKDTNYTLTLGMRTNATHTPGLNWYAFQDKQPGYFTANIDDNIKKQWLAYGY